MVQISGWGSSLDNIARDAVENTLNYKWFLLLVVAVIRRKITVYIVVTSPCNAGLVNWKLAFVDAKSKSCRKEDFCY